MSKHPATSLDPHATHAGPTAASDEESKDRGSIKLMEVHLTSVPVPNKDGARLGVASPSSMTTSSSSHTATISTTKGEKKPAASSTSASSSTADSTAPTTEKTAKSESAQKNVTTESSVESDDLAWPESGSDMKDDPSVEDTTTPAGTSDDGSSDPTESMQADEASLTTMHASNMSSSQAKKKKNSNQDNETATPPPTSRRGLSHYETREERLARIRKQFSQLNQSSQDDNGFLDTNSLVGFFADITPDQDVQRRYADELLQLCHSRKLRRNNNGGGAGQQQQQQQQQQHHRPRRSTGRTIGGSSAVTATATGPAAVASAAGLAGSAVPSTEDLHQQAVEQEKEEEAALPIDLSSLSSEAGVEAGAEVDGVFDTMGTGLGAESLNDGDDEDGDEDGKRPRVLYSDFQIFVEEKEERLWNLFQEIDHNNDNEIQPEELQASLAKAGIHLSDRDLEQFVKAMDKDGNGVIDYDEWRDFLVLLPRETTLKEIYKYVQEVIAQVGVDGDVVIPPSDHEYIFKYLLAGAIAGAVSRTVTAPLDRLKVYLITNSAAATLTGPKAAANLKNIPSFSSNLVRRPPQQRLLWTAIMDLYHQDGIRTFFRGNGLNIIKIAPESAIKFYTYETSKWLISTHLPFLTNASSSPLGKHNGNGNGNGGAEISTAGRFLAGGIAGLASQFSIYPLETIKTRIMSSTSKKGLSGAQQQQAAVRLCISSVGKEIWQRAGVRGFYRGLGASLVGIFPYAAIDLSVFETLKFGYMKWRAKGSPDHDKLERPSVFVLLACGTISGSVGATTVYPLSLVRTRLQAQGTPHHPQTYSSTLDVFRKTYQQDGIRGFYKGMVPTLTKVVPAVSISYVVYEYSKQKLGLDR